MNSVEFILAMQSVMEDDNYERMLELIKKPEVDINLAGIGRVNCLHSAIYFNKPVFVELFLMMNANPYAPSNTTGTPFDYAEQFNASEEVKRFFQKSPPLDPLIRMRFLEAVKLSDLRTVRYLLSTGFNFDDSSLYEGRYTALGIAIQKGNFEIVKELVLCGALISDLATQVWLKHHKTAKHQPIIQLLALEKQKQIDIMQAFCEAPGEDLKSKLDNAREKIHQIQAEFHRDVKDLTGRVSEVSIFQEQKSAPVVSLETTVSTIPTTSSINCCAIL